jgi:hypothetical protein
MPRCITSIIDPIASRNIVKHVTDVSIVINYCHVIYKIRNIDTIFTETLY